MSYTCPDCDGGELEAKIREIELEEGETITTLENGHVIASKIACSNEDCSSHSSEAEEEDAGDGEAEEEDAGDGEECGINECAREKGHTGNHRRRTKPKD